MGAHDMGDHTVFTKGDNEEPKEPEINWGYNCLTTGVHHGRPEQVWNIPLFQALMMFDNAGLKQLVVARIHNDAMMYVNNPETQYNESWADRVAKHAEERFDDLLAAKLTELEAYYDSPGWYEEMRRAIGRLQEDKLNRHWAALHGHDSINMLCRMLGTSGSMAA